MNLIKISSVLNHLHGRRVIGFFDSCFCGGSLWIGDRSVISFILHKSIFMNFITCGDIFYNRYIKSEIRTKYIGDDGAGMKPKQTFTQD